jgi:hypothetical protein
VILNGYPSGTTPFKTEKLEAGLHRLRLDMPAYKLIDDSLTITAGKVEKREFSLEHTVAWRDSVAAVRRDSLRSIASAKQVVKADKGKKPKKNPALKITFGVLSLVSAATGVYFDFMIKDQISKNNSLKSDYALLSDNSRYPYYSSQISHNTGSAKSFQLSEYVCYGLAGACATGFFISLAF